MKKFEGIQYVDKKSKRASHQIDALIFVKTKSKGAFKYKKSTNTYKYKPNNMVNRNTFT